MSYPTLTPASTTSAIVLTVTGSTALVNTALPHKIYSEVTSPLYSADFLAGASEQVAYVYKKLGGDVLDIEITPGNVYAAYEEACLEYSYIVNVHQASNLLANALGDSTGSFDHKGHIKETDPGNTPLATVSGSHVALKYPRFEYGMSRRVAEGVSSEVGLGSSNHYSASFSPQVGQQDYDLQSIITSVTNVTSSSTVTITDANELAAGDKIEFKTTDGTAITATATAIGGNTTSDNSNNPKFALHASANTIAANLASSLNANSRLAATAAASLVTIRQIVGGADGNTTITLTDAGTAGMKKENFASGSTTTPYAGKINGKRILVKKVFYKTPHAMWRFYGYYGGLNVVGNMSSYGQFSDDSTFQLVPTWQNKAQALAFEDAIYTRLSHFSYEIHNNKLRIYPIPELSTQDKMWVEFSIPTNAWESDGDGIGKEDGINNLNTLPLANLPYDSINSIGKQWIRRFSLALCKEILGQIRSKFSTIPIPGESITLNGSDLIAQGREEQDKLREELKTTLSELTYAKLSESTANQIENANKVMEQMPMYVFVG